MAGAAAAPSVRNDSSCASSSSQAKPWWYALFFLSGFPALLYQIVWERALFTLYGVNIESVTMIVTAFLLGLGLGSLLGGSISRNQHWPLLGIFGSAELLIACYGFASMRIFHWAANFSAGLPPLQTGLIAFVLIVLPTLLMGATLPILVAYSVRFSHNVGTSVGALYSANTVGSAVACFCAGLFLMRWLGQVRTVALAALLNAVVGTTLLLWQFLKRQRESTLMENPRPRRQFATRPTTISLPTASIVSFVAGFVALGFEIVWYRLFHFTTAGVAKSFAFLLGTYLAGIAAGSMLANRFCKEIVDPRTSIRFLAAAMFGANLLSFLAGPILFSLVTRISYLWVLIPIGFAASCLGIIFPMLCHVSIAADESAGPQTSYIYLSNIAGSAFGSYFTGFVLMDALPLRHVSVVLTLVGLLLAITLLLWTKSGTKWLILSASAALAAVLFVVQFSAPLFQDMYDKMLWKALYPTMGPTSPQKIAAVIETRSGIINVTRDGTVFGNGAYDGHLNLSLTNDTNGISRLFTLSYFHPDPKEVLMIGLSSGSWAQVMANHPQLAHLTIVEINPGYLPLIANRDEVASLLNNPKVHIDIDDGRRWLIRHPERKYDAIVMNTTFNWRSNISNLLSVEFLQLIREHLKPGGVEFYNTTFSDEAMATGLKVFPYGMRVAGFLAVSDSPLQLNAQRWSSVLEQYRIDGKPLFDLPREQSLLEAILLRYRLDGTRVFDVPRDPVRFKEVQSIFATFDHKLPGFFTLESAESMRRRMADVRLITDDNMGTEWQH